MGGGDLNLKKSWHPSTLRNIERVWKAEQKHEAEIQKIEQLQKELAEERAREEIQTFAEDQGVVKKKEEKLDWMYQGASAMINRDEFLLGKKIDNTFEKMQLIERGKAPEDETADIGSTLFSSQSLTGTATVDLATKIREDPLFNIMKKEKEQRKNLLTNPVKMKQLQQMLKASLTEKSKKKNKKSKKKKHHDSESEEEVPVKRKKHKKHKSSSSDDEQNLLRESKMDSRLINQPQREYLSDDEEKIHKKKYNDIRSSHKNGESSNFYSSKKYSQNERYNQDPSGKYSRSEQDHHFERTSKNYSKYKESEKTRERREYSPKQRRSSPHNISRYNSNKGTRSESTSPPRRTDKYAERRNYSPKHKRNSPSYSDRYNGNTRNRLDNTSPPRRKDKIHGRQDYSPKQQRSSSPKNNGLRRNRSDSSSPPKKPDKSEAERLLKEMQDNAKWRERQRKKNTERYREEDEKEDNVKRIDASDFMKPMLSKAAGKGSLENRVKQKIFSIQRSSTAMDKHFARRD